MFFDIQKASLTKRISALLLDIILLTVAATGFGFVVSKLVGYDEKYDRLEYYYDKYESDYNISFDITEEEAALFTQEETDRYTSAANAMNEDEGLKSTYSLVVNLTLVILSGGILLGYLLTEFAVPMIMGNGQTIGKRIFGLCLMQKDQTKLKPFALAIRTILGKYAVETMIPVLIIVMLLAGTIGSLGTMLIGLLLTAQIILLIRTPEKTVLHDLMAATVVVDMKSQKIFDNPEAKEQFKIKMEKGSL